MTIQQFIEKAIEGGWRAKICTNGIKMTSGNWLAIMMLAGEFSQVWFLDPLAWQAVGKVEGWGSGCNICLKNIHSYAEGYADECKNPKEHLTENHRMPWQINMHRMIDALCEGKTLEEFISTL